MSFSARTDHRLPSKRWARAHAREWRIAASITITVAACLPRDFEFATPPSGDAGEDAEGACGNGVIGPGEDCDQPVRDDTRIDDAGGCSKSCRRVLYWERVATESPKATGVAIATVGDAGAASVGRYYDGN